MKYRNALLPAIIAFAFGVASAPSIAQMTTQADEKDKTTKKAPADKEKDKRNTTDHRDMPVR